MFFWSIVLFVIAIVIIVMDIFFEVFGIIGLFGIGILLASLFLTYNFVPNGEMIVLGKLLFLIPIGGVVGYVFKKKQVHHKIFLNETLASDDSEVVDWQGLIGKEGKAITALRPYGHVDFDGIRVEARSESSYILAGAVVKAVYVKDNILFVRVVEEE